MKFDFVYGKKNKLEIKLRRGAYLSLRAASRAAAILKLRKREDDREVSSIALVLHRNATEADMGDALNRLAWFVGNKTKQGVPKVVLVGPSRLVGATPRVPKSQRNYLDRIGEVETVAIEKADLGQYDAVMLWRVGSVLNPRNWRALDRWHLGDPNIYSGSDFGNGIRIAKHLSGRRCGEEIAAISKRNFETLKATYAGRESGVVLGTGPSLQTFDIDAMKGKVVVACNAIVKNTELLEKLKPAAICFADPVFHLGPSEYAATFRDDLVRAVEKYSCFAATLSDAVDLFLRHYPELEDRIIGFDTENKWSIPTAEKRKVRATSNILTMLMLPLSAALVDDIEIGGCDGRKPDENYFWKHNASTQYEGLMKDVFLTHPSFFRDRVYSDYYDEHCDMLEDQLAFYEARGKRFKNVTCSYIPALERRG